VRAGDGVVSARGGARTKRRSSLASFHVGDGWSTYWTSM
jgi:hypothetical protein